MPALYDPLTLRSLTGYRELEWDAYQDYANSFAGAPLFPVSFVTTDLVDSEQFSQEFQFVGEWGERLRYVGGLYYFDESASHYQRAKLPDQFDAVLHFDVTRAVETL